MKNETNNGITRRSFIKRSTVAAIAASNLAIFSGIVNAYDESPSPGSSSGNCSPIYPAVGDKCHHYSTMHMKGWYCDCLVNGGRKILHVAKCDDKNGTNARCI